MIKLGLTVVRATFYGILDQNLGLKSGLGLRIMAIKVGKLFHVKDSRMKSKFN